MRESTAVPYSSWAPVPWIVSGRFAGKKISVTHFESHYLYRERIPALRQSSAGFDLKMKLGLEAFDWGFREKILKKGIPDQDPRTISRHFQEANFLFGIQGQTVLSMENDILLGLVSFERICTNLMCPNSTVIRPDRDVLSGFMDNIYPKYRDNERIDILIENTGFGVGG